MLSGIIFFFGVSLVSVVLPEKLAIMFWGFSLMAFGLFINNGTPSW